MLLEEADGQAAAKAAATSMAHKIPMLSAILDACETLKALQASSSSPSSPPAAAAGGNGGNGNNDGNGNQKHTFSGEALAGAKGLIFMRTDKVRERARCARERARERWRERPTRRRQPTDARRRPVKQTPPS